MIERKWQEGTLRGFATDIKKSTGPEAVYGLVGVHYNNPSIDREMLCSPVLEILPDSKVDALAIRIELKPAPEEVESLKRFEEYLEEFKLGVLQTERDPLPINNNHSPMSRYLLQGSALSDVQRFELAVPFTSPEIERFDFKLNGITYRQYRISGMINTPGYHSDGVTIGLDHTLIVLLKTEPKDHENFFSALVGKELLSVDARNVLDVLSVPNVTGFHIGGFGMFTEKSGITSSIWSAQGVHLRKIEDGDDKSYMIVHVDSGTVIEAERIKSMVVKRVGDFKYTLTVEMRDNLSSVIIHVG